MCVRSMRLNSFFVNCTDAAPNTCYRRFSLRQCLSCDHQVFISSILRQHSTCVQFVFSTLIGCNGDANVSERRAKVVLNSCVSQQNFSSSDNTEKYLAAATKRNNTHYIPGSSVLMARTFARRLRVIFPASSKYCAAPKERALFSLRLVYVHYARTFFFHSFHLLLPALSAASTSYE